MKIANPKNLPSSWIEDKDCDTKGLFLHAGAFYFHDLDFINQQGQKDYDILDLTEQGAFCSIDQLLRINPKLVK